MTDAAKEKGNFSKLFRLIINSGNEALRRIFNAIHPPSTLPAVLNDNKNKLEKIKYRVITHSQWDLLFPISGAPDSKTFDITLSTILLSNICGLPSPSTGWDVMPPVSDFSTSANIVRIKIFRDRLFKIPDARIDELNFEKFWQDISKALIQLKTSQQEIDELKKCTLSPKEVSEAAMAVNSSKCASPHVTSGEASSLGFFGMERNSVPIMFPFVAILLREVCQIYIFQVIDALSDSDPNTALKIVENVGAAYSPESSNIAEDVSSSELLNSTSDTKIAFKETLHSLDLFENYLRNPSEKTAQPLKLSFDRGKSAHDEHFTQDKINNFLDFLRSCLIDKCFHNDKGNDMDLNRLPNSNENFSVTQLTDESEIISEFPQAKKKKESKKNHSNSTHLVREKKISSEQKLEKNRLLKSKKSAQFPNSPIMIKSQRFDDLEKENHFLRNQIKSLQSKIEDLLSELGQLAVQTTAKENEERKSELFQKIFRPPFSEVTALPTSKQMSSNDKNTFVNRSQKTHTTNENADLPSVTLYPPTSAEQHVQGAEVLVQTAKQEIVTSGKIESEIQKEDRNENQSLSTQTSSTNTATEGTTSVNENNQTERVQETSGIASTSHQSNGNISLSVQQTESQTEHISLGNEPPPTSVATTLYNNYKLLLLSLGPKLLSSDVEKLKDWARENFSINDPQNATDVLLQLDQKAVINASNLSLLVHFFESIVRIDLVHIIDTFLLGDYSLLRQISRPKQQTGNAVRTSQHRSARMYQNLFNAMNTGRQSLVSPATSDTFQTNTGRNAATQFAGNSNETQRSPPEQVQRAAFGNLSDTAIPARRSPNENQSTASEQQNLKHATTGFGSNRMADTVVADGSNVTNERRTMAGNFNPSVTNNSRNSQAFGSNGSKHSKFQRPGTERSDVFNFQLSHGDFRKQFPSREDNWLCTHYKRHCYVKFECCDTFWPCHRCHNNQSTCGQKKLKSRDTKMVKCAYCNKEQQFGTSCCNCGVKFSEYYCGLCKHLTGTDDNPYHCDKCGICRIHGDRSYHCDVCGVCLDVQLRGNHKCREGSAHDECCICLEDAFTGCQILPCSHKVHRECATQMIRSGITRCPICRESFEHKLERRPLPNSRKRSGK